MGFTFQHLPEYNRQLQKQQQQQQNRIHPIDSQAREQ